jgi:hypothetical protein
MTGRWVAVIERNRIRTSLRVTLRIGFALQMVAVKTASTPDKRGGAAWLVFFP